MYRDTLGIRVALTTATAAILVAVQTAQAGAVPLISCPLVDAREVAALDARLRADLAVRSEAEGSLRIDCSAMGVDVVWQPAGGKARVATLQPRACGGCFVEDVLDATDRLLAPPASVSKPASAESPRPGQPTPVAPPRASAPLLLAGFIAEHWSGPAAGAVGARAGSYPLQGSGWAIGVAAEFRWVLGKSDLMQARLSDFGLAGALAIDGDALWWVHGGLAAGSLVVTPADSAIRGNGNTFVGTTWVGVNRLVPAGSLRLAIGPEIRLHDRERTIALDGEPIVKVPQLAAGMTLMIGF